MFEELGHWYATHDKDPAVIALYERHYSARPKSTSVRMRYGITGGGEALILLTAKSDALFGWRVQRFRADAQTGVECFVFRNESEVLSSELVAEAMELAWRKWPGERLFTFVNRDKVQSTNPGYCFQCAGWRTAGKSQEGLIILECFPVAKGE